MLPTPACGVSVAYKPTPTANPKQLHHVVRQLAKRYFVLRDAHDTDAGLRLLQPRWAYSFMRGPMTRSEIARAVKGRW